MNNTTRTANNTPSNTPAVDALLASMESKLTVQEFWMLTGWAARLRATRHAIHAANSWAKHRNDFGPLARDAQALSVARIYDYGESMFEAVALLAERINARAEKEGE